MNLFGENMHTAGKHANRGQTAMTELVDLGLTKAVGVCNFKVSLLHELLQGTDHKPTVAQSECHPYVPATSTAPLEECGNIGYDIFCAGCNW